MFGKKTTASPHGALFVTGLLHTCVLLAGLMFMPSSSGNMQRGCQISCCQMIMETFFSSGEKSLRIWMFSLEVGPGADFRERSCIWHQSCVIFRCQCISHLCNGDFPEGIWTHASLHIWTNLLFYRSLSFMKTCLFLPLPFWERKTRPPATPPPSLSSG